MPPPIAVSARTQAYNARRQDDHPVKPIETDRLVLRRLAAGDAPFILRILNEPSFLQHIGDRGARSLEDAKNYIISGPMASYDTFGFGLFLVELKGTRAPIGICGLLKRDALDDVDLGFAFVPESWSRGYAFESAAAMLAYGRDTHGLQRIAAITSPDNVASINLLQKLGFRFERMVQMPGDEHEVKLFARGLAGAASLQPGAHGG
jgi:RimJ/RimL family protein N-acetyltransferase